MGLGIAIAGSISIVVVFMVITVIPGTTDKLVDVIDARSQINTIQKKISSTDLQISSLTAEVGSDIFAFDLKNIGSEKIWNYDQFNFIITYDADVSGTKTRLDEKFTYNDQASFLGTTINQFARPNEDIQTGGWNPNPRYAELNEVIRNDASEIQSVPNPNSPANDVEVKLSSLDDPNTGYGHILRYTYKSDLVAANSGLLGYGEASALAARFRTWDGSNFSAEGSAPQTMLQDIQWVVVKSSPVSTEKIMGVLEKTTNVLTIQTWTEGSGWVFNWFTVLGNSDSRRFDIAYEGTSGDAIVVFGDGTNLLKYRKRVAGTWDAINQSTGITLADVSRWIVTKQRPIKDDIFIGVLTHATTLTAAVWNGTTNTWTSTITTTATPFKRDYQCFDIAFEAESGNAFLIWSDNANNLKYKKFTSSWQSEQTAYSGLDKPMRWIVAEGNRDKTSNQIAVGMIGDGASRNLEVSAWDGNSWVTRPSIVKASSNNERPVSVGFDRTGNAMFVFGLDSSKTKLSWRTWSNENGFSSISTESGDSGTLQFVQLRPDPLSNKMISLYVDNNKDVFYRTWDGSSWSSLGSALELNSSNDGKEAFMFAWHNVPITTLTVQLKQGSTIIAQFNEGNIYGLTSYVQKDQLLTASEANAITDYSDLRVVYKVDGTRVYWSWTELQISSFPGNPNEWGINNIRNDGYDPKILNPGETASILGRLPYTPYQNGLFKVSVIDDKGNVFSSSITVP